VKGRTLAEYVDLPISEAVRLFDGLELSDREALIATFADLSVPHTAQVRSLMLEVQWGEPPTSWLALARPALRSLYRMADQIGMARLTAALDEFDAALDAALAAGSAPTVTTAVRDALLTAYAHDRGVAAPFAWKVSASGASQ
jgi:hypothetical protein